MYVSLFIQKNVLTNDHFQVSDTLISPEFLLSFGLPYHNQNGGIIFTSTQAKNISATIFNLAELDLRSHFKDFPNSTSQQLKNYFINRMDFYMKASTFGQGKVGVNGSVNPINPVPAVPYDPITGGGPC